MVAVFALDKSRNCVFLNANAELLTGVPHAHAAGRPFHEVAWRNNPISFDETGLARAIASGQGGEGEETFRFSADHGPQPCAFRVTPMSLGDGATIIELVDLGGETATSRALRESESRFRLAVEATGIGIWDVNAQTDARRWSPEFCTILGLPPGSPADPHAFSDLIYLEDREWVNEAYRTAFSSPDAPPYRAEFRIVRASDGSLRWVAATGRVTFDGAGKALRGLGTLQDITDRRQVEETLRESEERLRIALVAGRMGTWRWNLVTGEQQWDQTQYRLFGIDPALPPSRSLFMSAVHPEDIDKVKFDIAASPLDSGFLDAEFRVVWPDGHVRWITAHSLVRYDRHGRAFELIGVNHDVTERKMAEATLRVSEERHRLAVEANEVGTWDYDIVTGEHRWSDQFKALWGLAVDAPCDLASLRALISREDWERVRDRWRAATDPNGEGRISIELELRRANDDERRWATFAGQVFFDEYRHKPLRAVGIMIDATDRKALEERQRLVLREMNHRVKNSLAVVQAIVSQTIRMSRSPAEAFERIQSRVMSVARTHDFLDRSSSTEASLRQLIAIELEPFVDDMRNRVKLDGPLVILESSSVLALGLTFHELATNSVKYGSLSVPKGRLEVTWRLKTDGEKPPVVEIIWNEVDGPLVRTPKRRGFGSRLIDGSVGGNLGGTVEADYSPTGLKARLSFPLRPVAAAQ
jgi:PAS domain S-box-containing protein